MKVDAGATVKVDATATYKVELTNICAYIQTQQLALHDVEMAGLRSLAAAAVALERRREEAGWYERSHMCECSLYTKGLKHVRFCYTVEECEP